MRIARIIDLSGGIRHGVPTDDSHIRPLAMSPLDDLTLLDGQIEGQRWLAPVAPPNIFCIGLNYRAHAQETGADLTIQPVVFMKPTTTINDPRVPIELPAACEQGPEVDYEAELAVIIGRSGKDIPLEQALDYVFGYTCANDISARRWQKQGGGGQWIRGKSFDTFCPIGPVLVTADEIPDPQALEISCTLNGQRMQEGNTSDMIFSVAELISFLSRDTTLLPGTLILTGTPPGVGFARKPPVFLANGDCVQIEIGGIGVLENPVIDAPAR